MTSRTERVIGEYKSAREKALIEVSSNANKMHGGSSEKVIKIVSTIVDNINACNERFCVIPIWILSDPLPGQWGYDSLSCEWSMVECLFSGSGFEFQFLSAFDHTFNKQCSESLAIAVRFVGDKNKYEKTGETTPPDWPL
ncbi:MAG: hypothetical protein CMK32_10185 [Porticoccaceae bacterium]|nr:hypothetical protein [Porticoccaceae bacterium]